MNKILSQAIRKAVSDYTPNVNQDLKDKRLDLFSLNSETELFQNSKGITIKIDRSKDDNFCLLYTSPSPRDATLSRMPSSA